MSAVYCHTIILKSNWINNKVYRRLIPQWAQNAVGFCTNVGVFNVIDNQIIFTYCNWYTYTECCRTVGTNIGSG